MHLRCLRDSPFTRLQRVVLLFKLLRHINQVKVSIIEDVSKDETVRIVELGEFGEELVIRLFSFKKWLLMDWGSSIHPWSDIFMKL